MFSANFAQAFDPRNGNSLFNVTGVPSGTQVLAPDGSILRYVFGNGGTTSSPSYYLAEWNSSLLWNNVGTTPTITSPVIANVPLTPGMPAVITTNPYTWNGTAFVSLPAASIPKTIPGTTTAVAYAETWNGNAWINYTTSAPLNQVYQYGGWAATPSTTSSLTLAGLTPATIPSYDWNVTVASWYPNPSLQTIVALNANNNVTSPTVVGTAAGPDVLLGINGTTSLTDVGYTIWGGVNNGTANPYTMWAVSLSPQTAGTLLWMKTYTAPSNAADTGVIVWPETVDFPTGIFTMYETDTQNIYGYNIATGNQVWGPVTDPYPFDVFVGSVNTENTGSHHVAYGNLYISGYGGILQCYNDSTGALEFTYGNGGEGNSTVAGLGTPWGNLPLFIAGIADGKVYLFNDEHSPSTPEYKGTEVRCVDAYNGTEYWTLNSWGDGGGFVGQCGAIADGQWIYMNTYDMQIYSIGQGTSQTTVQAPLSDITLGQGLVIRGTVIDTSAGTKQQEQAADFPNGVPAVSDASQASWMEYVYQQKPMPTNVTGVPVTITVTDSNGNTRPIGTVTTDPVSGMFSLNWKPDIAGNYTVYATFAGSNSYWGSNAETSFSVDAAPQSTAAPTPTAQSAADMYFVPAIAGLFVAIIIVIVLLAIVLLRKHP